MKTDIRTKDNLLRFETSRLMNKMMNPLCGISQQLGFVHRSRYEPALFTAGADLAGVHVLLNAPPPKRGAYHIGGSGIYFDEAVIRSLAESVERYSQLLGDKLNKFPKKFCSYDDLVYQGEKVLPAYKIHYFSEEQLKRKRFPFKAFDKSEGYTWIKVHSISHYEDVWIPIQLLIVGYEIKKSLGESWINSAVTTGTATHINHVLSMRNALLELIQIDTAMGHWYTSYEITEIQMDHRTAELEKLINKNRIAEFHPQFYWLPNPDLPGFVIACTIRKNAMPYFSIGLGADLKLSSAMYKAYLEAVGVSQLSKILLLDEKLNATEANVDTGQMFDLDSNVAWYAKYKNNPRIDERFNSTYQTRASDLPADDLDLPHQQLKKLIKSFKETGKELFFVDLTAQEILDLGLTVSRLWSPDTLSLSIPSAVPVEHPRFQVYGGIQHDDPHPYP